MFLDSLISFQPRLLPAPAPIDEIQLTSQQWGFMASEGCRTGFGAPGFDSRDDGMKLEVSTKGISLVLVGVCLSIPAVCVFGLFVYRLLWQGIVDPAAVLMCLMCPLAMWQLIALVQALNNRARAGQVQLILDRQARTLELAEAQQVIFFESACRLILVSGIQWQSDARGSNGTRAYELSVIANVPDAGLQRFYVLTTGSSRIKATAQEMSQAMHVPLWSAKAQL